jgi:hypothetical protein
MVSFRTALAAVILSGVPLTNGLAATPCIDSGQRFNAGWASFSQELESLGVQGEIFANNKARCPQMLPIMQAWVPKFQRLENDMDSICRAAGLAAPSWGTKRQSAIIQDQVRKCEQWLAASSPGSKQATGQRCAVPAPGRTTTPANDGSECIIAANTNADHQCRYSYSYVSSITGNMGGPTLAAGTTDRSVCGRPNEHLRFGKWTLIPPSAR